jgi:carbonic anhydrase/acetyltransferase-like protein (isoleucine patch superfamily)
MAYERTVNGKTPAYGQNCFIAENATVVGEVVMGDDCSVWFNAVIRGDVNSIRIGSRVNIQDAAIIHCTYQKAATVIGDNVSIGHRAIVHGCTIEDNALIGMGAIIMDHAIIGKNAVIAAGAVVLENTVVPPGTVYGGIPAKKLKDAGPELLQGLNERIAANYVMYASWFRET